MATWNLNNTSSAAPIDIHVSCSAPTPYSVPQNDPSQPWGKFITYHPLISHIASSTVHFADDTELGNVDVVLFATGYVFSLPFCKATDSPWLEDGEAALLNAQVEYEMKGEISKWEEGGLRGQGIRVEGMDELLLFKKGDPSIALTGLGKFRSLSFLDVSSWRSIPSRPVSPRGSSRPTHLPYLVRRPHPS